MSTLRVNTLQDATGSNQPAMVGAAKAWVNFNGTGTVAIRAAFNVSSITDNGTGDYTVNFTTAMPDANYAITTSIGERRFHGFVDTSLTVNSFRVTSKVPDNDFNDPTMYCVAVFR